MSTLDMQIKSTFYECLCFSILTVKSMQRHENVFINKFPFSENKARSKLLDGLNLLEAMSLLSIEQAKLQETLFKRDFMLSKWLFCLFCILPNINFPLCTSHIIIMNIQKKAFSNYTASCKECKVFFASQAYQGYCSSCFK